MKVEGVEYEVEWDRFFRGTEIFIPCLDATTAWRAIRPEFRKRKILTLHKEVINEGIRGLRIWRI